MRIAAFHDLPSGGAKRALYEQVRGLRALGHAVDVFVPSTANEVFLPLADVAGSITTFDIPAPPNRERMLAGRPGALDPLRWLVHLARVRDACAKIAHAIEARGADVALVHPSQFTQAPWVLETLKTPSLYYCHEPLRAAYEPRITSAPMRLAIRATLGRVDRRNLRAASSVAVNSAFTAAAVRRIYGRESHVVYPGVDAQRFHPTGAPPADYVLAVGGLHPLKGLDFIVDALACIPPDRRPPLAVASDRARETERRRVREQAAARGVELRLHFQLTDDALVDLYNRARLVLCAQHGEPFGFVPLEAMACGRPVLAVDEGGLKETVVEGLTGFLAPRDVRRFGARVAGLLASRDAVEAVAQSALLHVREHWQWGRSVTRLEALLAQTAGSSIVARTAS